MDLAAAFLEVARRNALRRGAGLPLLDVRQEIAALRRREQAEAWSRAFERHRSERERLRSLLVEEHHRATGRDLRDSAGGRWALAYKSYALYASYLERLGYTRPGTRGVRYGSARRRTDEGGGDPT